MVAVGDGDVEDVMLKVFFLHLDVFFLEALVLHADVVYATAVPRCYR
jgi:hypothetical protein